MGILLCCFRITEHVDESRNVPRIRGFTNPITNNFSPKFKQLFESLERGEISYVADEEEDVCPTCFYEYVEENPKIVLQCGHMFHLACIYEWMERSEACPFCSKTMLFLKGDEITEHVE
ncbi:PREDICTED: E3 ubiquitin-protein ligase At3g02290-like [Camelina sativa]|uniref:RING-type E3 ubiquitin transferase n=1 Tax=Camelina sativa TaxID=90675 RepID=A0ABM0Z8J6_CAMSA|nr:PREDICTED: E3 ubiquitin-protein ligase At3g02290-like [Camelina sativa]